MQDGDSQSHERRLWHPSRSSSVHSTIRAMSGRRNHAAWIGPLVVFTGAVSYFLVFVRFPTVRDVPWVNLPWVAIGLVISFVGLRGNFALAP